MRGGRIKEISAICCIVFLLPYVATIMISGFGKPHEKRHNTSGSQITITADGITREMDREQYLVGVVAAQIPIDYEPEAIKAQAVLARTFFIRHELSGSSVTIEQGGPKYSSPESLKKLWGNQFQDHYQKLATAIEETADERITYEGNPIEPSFHAFSAGKTRSAAEVFEDNQYPYLQSVESSYDRAAPDFVKVIHYSAKEMGNFVKKNYGEEEAQLYEASGTAVFTILEKDSAGYVTKMEVCGRKTGGEQFRDWFLLPSANFSIQQEKGGVKFTCRGLGHGLGLSVYGANRMAKEGKNYREILTYYFKNIEISNE